MHEPAFVAALVSDNHGNVGGSLFGSDVKPRRVLWEILVEVPAKSNVTELEGSGEAAAHSKESGGALLDRQDLRRSTLCRALSLLLSRFLAAKDRAD